MENKNKTSQLKLIHYGKHSEGYILKHGVMKEELLQSLTELQKLNMVQQNQMAIKQESRVLMLSEKARGDANPILLN